jgi:hypothetical protein
MGPDRGALVVHDQVTVGVLCDGDACMLEELWPRAAASLARISEAPRVPQLIRMPVILPGFTEREPCLRLVSVQRTEFAHDLGSEHESPSWLGSLQLAEHDAGFATAALVAILDSLHRVSEPQRPSIPVKGRRRSRRWRGSPPVRPGHAA